MSKHTPGPWVFDGKETIRRPGDYSSDQADICYMNLEGGNESSDWFADPEVVKMDAILMTAAPKLLEALLRCKAQWIHSVNADFCFEALRAAGDDTPDYRKEKVVSPPTQ